MEDQAVGGHVGDESSLTLCFVFFFVTMVSNGVDRMRLQCSALNVKVVRKSKQARTNDRRNHDVCSDRSSLPSSFILVSLSHVSGVEQLYQARRMLGGIGNMLFSTFSQT